MMTDVNMDDLINKVHCLEFSDMCARLPDKSVDMILCDPPYAQTACAWDVLIPFDTLWTCFKRIIKPRGAIVLTATEPFASLLRTSWVEGYKYDWVWDKKFAGNFLMAEQRPLQTHENILVFNCVAYNPQMKRRITPIKTGGRTTHETLGNLKLELKPKTYDSKYPTSILSFPRQPGVSVHPTQKPVDLFIYLIKTYTQEGELVFDPCVGSGTTALASVNTGRNFICSDFTQEYVDIANARLERADPTKPTRLTDNHTQLSLLGLLGD